MEKSESICIDLNYIENGLALVVDARKANTLFEISDANENNEARYQLVEGCFYDYEFSNKSFHFEKDQIVQPHSRHIHLGTISPNIYVGTLSLPVFCDDKEAGSVEFEVQSVKSGYRDDYRNMLEFIAEKCTDLLLQANSPVAHHFKANFSSDSKSLYQKFAFVRSVIDTEEFTESIHRIVSSPVTKWKETDELTDIRKIRQFGSNNVREFISTGKKNKLSENHYLRNYGLHSVPEKINSVRKTDSVDTTENRFIKYAMEVFLRFCSDINKASDYGSRLNKESANLIRVLESYLNHSFFREISKPETLKLNSPVLQRKEGYREILRVWLMFDLAAKLIWKGGDDIYSAGKKDVAVLYEYWLFFKFLDLMQSVFKIEPKDISELMQSSQNGLELQLKQGRHVALKGVYDAGNRKLNIRFSYNRSFNGEKNYPSEGSWTITMRPDYTLSFWPYGISECEAEKQELIVHIHFDAKYRIADFNDLLDQKRHEEGNSNLDTEKEENNKGIYKNGDLLKMHAYRDAIRRTGGSYVLYPGNKPFIRKGFHEIIPGLGAFPVRPSKQESGMADLRMFISEVIEHFLNRASQREKLAFRVYDIHKNDIPNELKDTIPEAYGENRALMPDETFVLVGYCKDNERYKWYIEKGLYNFRINDEKGSLALSSEVTNARYLLLRRSGRETADELFKITSRGPKVYSSHMLIGLGYPDPRHEYYLVIEIKQINPADFGNVEWNFKQLPQYKEIIKTHKDIHKIPGIPFTVTLTDLMKIKNK